MMRDRRCARGDATSETLDSGEWVVECNRTVRVVAVLATLAAGCGGDADKPVVAGGAPAAGNVEVLISTDDGVIGQISDLIVMDDGTVLAVDRQAGQVHMVDASGSQLGSLGRSGAGPNEFSQPATLEARGDTLYVVDWGNGRLQAVTIGGDHVSTSPLPPGQAPSIGGGMRFVRPTWGIDTMLAVIHRPDLSTVAEVGRVIGVPMNTVYPRRMKQEIAEGRVPDIMLNMAEAIIGPDSTVWLFVAARGSIQRFDAEGREMCAVDLDEAEREALFAEFVSENAEKPIGSFFGLQYLLDVTLVGDEAWVLLGNSLRGTASVRVLGPEGELGRRIEFPGIEAVDEIAVDPDRGYVYFIRPDAAELVRVPM